MGRTIRIFDTTLRDGEQSPGCSMNLNEKIEVARQLESMKVDIIEAGFAIASPGDAAAIAAIADTVHDSTVCSLARCVEKDIDAAYNAIKRANSARIHVFLATSPLHMQYKLKMTPEEYSSRSHITVLMPRSILMISSFLRKIPPARIWISSAKYSKPRSKLALPR